MCGGGCNTSQATTAANPQAQAAYTNVVGQAQQVASTPYQPYTGELVAGLNGGQQTAVGQLQGAYGAATPYVNEGGQYVNQGAQGLGNVQNYLQAGSDAAAGASPFQAAASNELAQGNVLVDQAAQAYGGVGAYQSLAQGAYGQEQAGLGAAQGYFGQAAGLATPQDFASNVGTYENPFTSDVINTTMAEAEQADHAQASSLASNEIGSGAYGGDRGGIAQAALAGQQDMANNSTIAGLNQANFSQATSEFNAVQQQRQQGAQIYAGLGSAATQNALGYGQVGAGYAGLGQMQGQVAQGLGNLGATSAGLGSGYAGLGQLSLGQAGEFGSLGQLQGTTGQAYGTLGTEAGNLGALGQSNLISGASAGLQGATLQQQNQQQQDTAAYNQYMAGLSYPYQNVGFLSNIVQGIGSQEGNTQTTQGNALSSIAGLGTSAIGILGATGGFGANGYLSGLGSSIGSLFTGSDARIKEDVAPIGKTFDGQTLYRYRYKGDPEVRTGLIAQEVAQRDPGAVANIGGGVLGVDYDRATRRAAVAGLGAAPGQGPRPQRAAGGVAGFGMSPMGGPTAPMVAGLGARPRFDDGGAAAIPSGGLNTSPAALMGAGAGLNMSPSALTGGAPTAHPPQAGLGALRSPLATMGPTSPQFAGGFGAGAAAPQPATAGLGAAPTGGGSGYVGASQDPSSAAFSPGAASGADSAPQAGLGASPSGLGGISQNGWMGVLAAGLGMMGGTSASATANIGRGALEGLQMYQGLQQQDANNAYRQRTLAQGDREIDLRVQDMLLKADQAQKQLAIESGTLANNAANTNSEVAARAVTTAAQRYPTMYVAGDGMYYRDTLDPTKGWMRMPTGGQPGSAAPSATASPAGAGAPSPSGGVAPSGVVPLPQASPSAGTAPTASPPPAAGAAPPPPSGSPPTASAPPSGGVSISGGPQPGAPAGAAAGLPSGPAPQGGPPKSGPVSVGAAWSPTLAPMPGYLPPNQFGIAQSPELAKQQSDIGAKGVQDSRESAQKAAAAQMQLSGMQTAMAALPKSGLLAPGQFGDERATIAKSLNGVASVLGADPVFDPNTIADTELMKKEAFRLGTQMMADTNGGREAGFILQNSVAATPSLNNSPLGFQRLAAGLQQANQYKQDRAAFMDAYYGKFGNLDGAQQEFTRLNPPQAYANRAIVSTIPRDYVQRLQQTAGSNPGAAQFFDQRFGVGASTAVLGQQQ